MTIQDLVKKITRLRQWLLFKKIGDYTMVGHNRLYFLVDIMTAIERHAIKGAFVECGVWKGGVAGVMADFIKKNTKRDLWLFDSFQGLPQPCDVDGAVAMQQYKNDKGVSSVSDVEHVVFDMVGASKEVVRIIPGWFEQSLPKSAGDIGQISLLRLDCDWYESTKTCLQTLYDYVVPGGYVLIDDYGTWPGSRKAVDEFLALKGLNKALLQAGDGAMYWQKPLDDAIADYWSAESQKYVQPHCRIKKIARELKFIDDRTTILDIGCGPAPLAKLLTDAQVKYYGVDVFNQDGFPGYYKKFDLSQDDFSVFPFKQYFTNIVMSGVLEYLSPVRASALLAYVVENLSNSDTQFVISFTNFSHYSRAVATYHPEWKNIMSVEDFIVTSQNAGLQLVRYYPSYYLVFGRRIDLKLRFWVPLISKYFGRQIIYVFKRANANN